MHHWIHKILERPWQNHASFKRWTQNLGKCILYIEARIIKKGLCQNLGTSCVTYVVIHNLGKNLSEDLGEVLIKFSPILHWIWRQSPVMIMPESPWEDTVGSFKLIHLKIRSSYLNFYIGIVLKFQFLSKIIAPCILLIVLLIKHCDKY